MKGRSPSLCTHPTLLSLTLHPINPGCRDCLRFNQVTETAQPLIPNGLTIPSWFCEAATPCYRADGPIEYVTP